MRLLTESLESRRLLAGVTLLAHGYNGNVTGWVAAAATDIAERVGGTDHASIYTMVVSQSGGSLSVSSFGPDAGQKDFRLTSSAELVIKLDWSTVSDGSRSTQAVAQVVSNYFLTAHGNLEPLASLPIHLIGHSRGASLTTAMSQDFGEAGVWVDQVTSLDPHPVDGVDDFFGANFGDQKMASYDNVIFADDYWRTDGNPNNLDFDGEAIAGTYQGDLNAIVQPNFIGSAHAAVPAYYIGTIDTTTSSGGDHPVLPAWYGSTTVKPPRNLTGYIFSRLGGRRRPAGGVSTLLAGSGARVAAGQSGSQWSNTMYFQLAGSSTVPQGANFETRLYVQDRDSTTRVTLYLDSNRNPYDGATIVTGKTVAAGGLTSTRLDFPTTAVSPGTYNVAVSVTDAAGHSRWEYMPTAVTVEPPAFVQLVGRTMVINGTAGHDTIRLRRSGSNYIAGLNGVVQTIPTFKVDDIQILAGAGNDSINATGTDTPIYVNAGAGFDTIVGGDGNDTLSGGAQSNTILGGLGDDVLNGSAGNDSLQGAGGYDRLYSNGGLDTLDGGSNVDRLFGSDGNQLFIGGRGNDKIYAGAGNDTLIGGADVDILDGGDGIDWADDDSKDIRISIEQLLSK